MMKNEQISRREKRFKKYLIKKMNKAYRKYTHLNLNAEAQRDIFTYLTCIYEGVFEENALDVGNFNDIRNMKIVEEWHDDRNNTEE